MWQNNEVLGIQCCQNSISNLSHAVVITTDLLLMERQDFVEMSGEGGKPS